MPQILKIRRPLLDNRAINIAEKGDMCYVFTKQIIIPIWQEAPRWDTVSVLRMMLVQKPDITKLKHLVRGTPFNDDEVLNQAALAFEEFYRRVASNYEDFKARQNTDVYAGLQFAKSKQLMQGE